MLNMCAWLHVPVVLCMVRKLHAGTCLNFSIFIFDFFYSVIHKQASIEFTTKVRDFKCVLKLGFHKSGKSQMVWDFTVFPDRPRFCRLMKTRNRRFPRSSEINRDASGELGMFLFSRCVPDFCNDQGPLPTNENSNLYHQGRHHLSAMDFVHYKSPKLLKCCYISVQGSIFGHFPFATKFIKKSGTDLWWISDISAKSRMVSKK